MNSVNVQNENNNELKKAILIGIIVSIVGSIVVILILRFWYLGYIKKLLLVCLIIRLLMWI